MLKEFQNVFYSHLESFNREAALAYTLKLLESGTVTVVQLYEEIIAPSLGKISISREEEEDKIWQEHAMTSIARTVVECCFPYVLKQKNPSTHQNNQYKVVVLCPEEEYHDVGARMGADYFTLENYQVIFVGGNTPPSNILSVCSKVQPRWLAISVSNFYYLASVKNTIASLRAMPNPPGIILSGSAFLRTGTHPKEFGADMLIHTYQQVQELGGTRV